MGFSNRRSGNDHLLAAFRAQTLRFQTALENISQGLCFFDRNRRLIVSNRRYAEIYGLSPKLIRPGMRLNEIIALRAAVGGVPSMTPDEYIAWTQGEANAHAPNGAVVHLKTGRIVSVRHHPIEDGGYVSTHEDITERWIAEAALRHGEKLRAIGQMTGGVAHDLNNLLTMIALGIEDALAQPGDCGGTRPGLDATMRSVESAISLLRQMVNFSRSQPPVVELTELNSWLVPLQEMAGRLLGASHRLELQPDPTLPAWRVDRSQLESALLNLILNARDAMPQGGTITVATEHMRSADAAGPERHRGEFVAITVRDNGPGMPPEVAARVFEPFFSTKPLGSGTGLGLSMVQQFARQAGGAASLHSTPGVGTSVRIVLPKV